MVTFIQQRGAEVLRRLPEGPVVGAEIGIWDGRLSAFFLGNRDDLTLYMVDRWKAVPPDHPYYQSDAKMGKATDETFAEVRQKAMAVTEPFADRRRICQGESIDWAVRLQGTVELDFVFVDGEHTYAAVLDDLKWWCPLVKPGGWLTGHDWEHEEHLATWGVRDAVREFADWKGLKIELGENRTWHMQLPQ